MCGLLGHLGNKKNLVSIDKFNILGILNEERGTHSCGITMDGEILKGVDDIKVYRDFASMYKIRGPQKGTGIIGHTRHATFGQHTEENAHPFGFGELSLVKGDEPGFEFVGVHNGSLLNHTELATKGNIPLTKEIEIVTEVKEGNKTTIKKQTKTVTKIDSEVILERLYKDKNFKVLEEYNGAAALIWQDLNKPNTMYFYHGKSAKSSTDSELVEERPLYYWKENKNSLYVSSLIDSLYVIGGEAEEIDSFEHNVVYEIKDGDISKAKKTKINRSKNYKAKGYERPASNVTNRHFSNRNTNISETRRRVNARINGRGFDGKVIKMEAGTNPQMQLNLEVPVDKGLLAETFDYDPNLNQGLTMCKQLRYWRNGHLAEGIFLWINQLGFYHLGTVQKTALSIVEDLAGKFYYQGDFHESKPSDSKIPYTIPVDRVLGQRNPISYLHYMYNGIRLKTYTDYQGALVNNESPSIKFDIIAMSIMSCHPVIDLEKNPDKRISGAYKDGELANKAFSFLGSRKLYRFSYGQIKDISYIPGQEPKGYKTEVNTIERAACFLDSELKVNNYTKLKKQDLLRELLSLNDVIAELEKSGEGDKIKKVSEAMDKKVEDIITKAVENADDVDNFDYKETLEKLDCFKPMSTKAALACDVLTKIIQIDSNE